MTADAIRAALACDASACACRRPTARATHCPAHPDRSPSLGVDQYGDRVLVHCRAACSQQAVIEALRGRGLWPSAMLSRPVRYRSLLEEARDRVAMLAERQRRRLEPLRPVFAIADWLRPRHQAVAEVRRLATVAGPGERVWLLLARAVRVEDEALAVELELNECLPLPRRETLDGPIMGRRS